MSNNRLIEGADTGGVATYKVYSDGTAIDPTYNILSIMVSSGVNMIGSAEIVLLDGSAAEEDFPISNKDTFTPGARIKIEAGYDAQDVVIFEGILVRHAVEASKHKPSMLKIMCKHDATKLSIQRKSAYFYDSLDSDVIEQLISDAGLTAEVEPTTAQHAELVQYYTTDWDYILSRAEANGLLVVTDGDTISVKPPNIEGNGEAVLSLGFGGNIISFEAEIDARYQYSGANAFSWDAAQQDMLEIPGTPPTSGLNTGSDAETLAGVIGLEALHLRHAGQLKDTELQAWADAQMLKSRLAKVRGRVSFEGFQESADASKILKAGELIELSGVGEKFNGLAFVSFVRHDITPEGWETSVEFGLSPEWFAEQQNDIIAQKANGLLPAVNGLQIGLVTALEGDPDGEDRVQVRIPVIDPGEDGVWARVATLDAGENRGTFFRPELGDEVLLGFLNDDPRNPIILGMMNSSAKPAPLAGSDDNHEKGYVSRSEMKMMFNDDTVTFSLETPIGKKITMDEDGGVMKLEDENDNVITMDSNGITIQTAGTLTLKADKDIVAEGLNITHTAKTQFGAEGSAGAGLKSGGQTVIEGSMVMIN